MGAKMVLTEVLVKMAVRSGSDWIYWANLMALALWRPSNRLTAWTTAKVTEKKASQSERSIL